MTKQEIREMIEHYGMIRNGDKIRMVKNVEESRRNIEAIKAAKPEIMAYWDAEEAAQKRRRETFLNIPGVREIRDARAEWGKYLAEFNRAMDRGDCIFPAKPASDLEGLEKAHPDAVFALEVYKKSTSANYEISDIAGRAYNALLDGEAVSEVRETYEAEMAAFVEKHQWD